MSKSFKSFTALNSRSLLSFGIVLSLVVLGIAGWGLMPRSGDQIASSNSDVARSETKMRSRDNPVERSDWFMYQRMYPFEKVPEDARRNAFEEVLARGEGLGPLGAA